MQMQVSCYNSEGTEDTTHHGQVDGFLKNWGRKKINRFSEVSHCKFESNLKQ